MLDFTNLLSRKADTVDRPVVFPEGSYVMTIVSYTTGESRQKKTPYVEIELKVVSPRDDVDYEEYAKVKNPQERSFKVPFYITEDSLYRLVEFLSKAGFDTKDKTISEMLAEVAGHNVVAIIGHRLGQDQETVYAEIKNFLKAE